MGSHCVGDVGPANMERFIVALCGVVLVAFLAHFQGAEARTIEIGRTAANEDGTGPSGARVVKRSPEPGYGRRRTYYGGYNSGYHGHGGGYNSCYNCGYNYGGHRRYGFGSGRPLRRLLRAKAVLGTGILIGSALQGGFGRK